MTDTNINIKPNSDADAGVNPGANADTTGAAPVITMDGPAGSGKGAVSQRVALQLGWHYLDSGALYRSVAVLAERQGLIRDTEGDEQMRQLAALVKDAEFACEARTSGWARIVLNGEDLSEAVREERISMLAAQVAKLAPVRAALKQLQHAQRRPPGLVAEGRDMGSVVFPNAEARFFITASVEVRAQRRHKQLSEKGFDVSIGALVRDLEERDHSDRTRRVSPLLEPASGVHSIDTSGLTIEQVVHEVISLMAPPSR